jgi:hypothetical protein
MLHMLGDYHSSIDPIPAFMIAGILTILLFIVVLIQLRKAEIKRVAELNASPTHTRSTYLAAEQMSMGDLDEIAKETNAITRTHS